jgi:hypothetical protein
MTTKYRLSAFVILAILSFLLSPYVKATAMNQEIVAKLVTTLNTFAKKNALNDAQLESLLGEIVLNGQKMKKGGVGVIDKETFVVLDDQRNTVVVAGKKWQGKPSNEHEVVLTDGRRVLSSTDDVDVSNLKILVFSPKEVRYINLSNNSGGKYPR